jgi:hypothetical protein
MKEAAMTNGVLISEANLAPNELSSTKSIGKKAKASLKLARLLQSDNAVGRLSQITDQSLLRGLLDPKSSSPSLMVLAKAAAFSGKRLVLEIRDDNPVRIIRTSTREM